MKCLVLKDVSGRYFSLISNLDLSNTSKNNKRKISSYLNKTSIDAFILSRVSTLATCDFLNNLSKTRQINENLVISETYEELETLLLFLGVYGVEVNTTSINLVYPEPLDVNSYVDNCLSKILNFNFEFNITHVGIFITTQQEVNLDQLNKLKNKFNKRIMVEAYNSYTLGINIYN